MPLRSDFKVTALTPEAPAIDIKEKTIFAEPANDGPASELKELFAEERRLLVAGRDVGQAPDIGERVQGPYRVAFLVTHGMGQQVPFETVSAIGQALITEHSKRHPIHVPVFT